MVTGEESALSEGEERSLAPCQPASLPRPRPHPQHALKSVALKLPMLVLLCSSSPRYGSVGEWLAWTAVFLWLSMFVRLASLRGDALLSAPATAAASPKAAARHARILLLLAGILAQDVSWIARHWRALAGGGPRCAGWAALGGWAAGQRAVLRSCLQRGTSCCSAAFCFCLLRC